MKKIFSDFHMSETTATVLIGIGFLALVYFLSYLFWFA